MYFTRCSRTYQSQKLYVLFVECVEREKIVFEECIRKRVCRSWCPFLFLSSSLSLSLFSLPLPLYLYFCVNVGILLNVFVCLVFYYILFA